VSYDHTAEAIFFAGIMWWLIRWIVRTVQDVSEESPPPSAFTASITQLESNAAPHTPLHELVSVSSGVHPYAANTPSIPVVAHCPVCGFTLTAEPQRLPFTAECPNCKRHISVRGDGPGRLSVVVSDAH
jgi:predicted Zn-ribbon and HTH transcriptional regulator